jgi:hypothetical protein
VLVPKSRISGLALLYEVTQGGYIAVYVSDICEQGVKSLRAVSVFVPGAQLEEESKLEHAKAAMFFRWDYVSCVRNA